jgi:hypothetical protein
VALNSAASNLLIISYSGNVVFSNLTDGVAQERQFSLLVGNGGFETGDFTDWQYAGGQANNDFVDSIDATDLFQGSTVPDVDDSLFIHSGIYGALLGQFGSLGSLSQTLPTTPGRSYLLSFWVDNPTNAPGFTLEFFAFWNNGLVYQNANDVLLPWTQVQTVVTATAASTVLQFQFRNDLGAWGLDDVSVQPQPPPQPVLQRVTRPSPGTLSLTWSTVPGASYQVQYKDSLLATAWNNLLTNPVMATGTTLSTPDSISSSRQKFYRIVAQ